MDYDKEEKKARRRSEKRRVGRKVERKGKYKWRSKVRRIYKRKEGIAGKEGEKGQKSNEKGMVI